MSELHSTFTDAREIINDLREQLRLKEIEIILLKLLIAEEAKDLRKVLRGKEK